MTTRHTFYAVQTIGCLLATHRRHAQQDAMQDAITAILRRRRAARSLKRYVTTVTSTTTRIVRRAA